jgi:uncharacterized protein YecT (DUF1311 family)
MRATILASMMLFSGVASASAQEDPQVDCNDAQNQMDMNYCAAQDFEKADRQLNVVYKKAVASQAAIDKDAEDETDPALFGAVKALKKAQRAWIDYRDGQCEGEGFQAAGGSMQPMLISGCKARLTGARTKELNDLISGEGN